MLRARSSPLCIAAPRTAALNVRAPLRRFSQPVTGDAAMPRTSRYADSAPEGAPRMDFGRPPRSQFMEPRQDRSFGAGRSFNRSFSNRDDRDDDRGARGFGDRGRDFGGDRGGRRFGGGDRRADDKSFYSQPLARDEDAVQEPYSPPVPKFETKPSWTSDAERTEWLKKHNVRLFGDNPPAPVRSWAEVNLPKEFMRHLQQFPAPTLIQSIALPIAIAGRDMIGIAETGSGKTLAFAVPALASFFGETVRPRFPRVVVLAPTRELAVQTAKVFDDLGAGLGVRTACVYGGASARKVSIAMHAIAFNFHIQKGQIEDINRGAGVIVATPGRLTDLVRSGRVSLSSVSYCVLDEADRMLDMGFAPQIDTILQAVPRKHQTLMFSATWPKEIRTLASQYLQGGVRVQIGSEEMLANPNIKQVVEVFQQMPTIDQRLQRLHELLTQYHIPKQKQNKIIVFVNTKIDADMVVDYLSEKEYRASALHGDYSQSQRDRAMLLFKQGRVPILVATDVAARGLDVPDVEYVINLFFPPGEIDQYVHRIGRTGRAGNQGIAHTIFTPNDATKKMDLIDILERAKQTVPAHLVGLRASRFSGKGSGGRGGGRSQGSNRRFDGGRGGNLNGDRGFRNESGGGGGRRNWNPTVPRNDGSGRGFSFGVDQKI